MRSLLLNVKTGAHTKKKTSAFDLASSIYSKFDVWPFSYRTLYENSFTAVIDNCFLSLYDTNSWLNAFIKYTDPTKLVSNLKVNNFVERNMMA